MAAALVTGQSRIGLDGVGQHAQPALLEQGRQRLDHEHWPARFDSFVAARSRPVNRHSSKSWHSTREDAAGGEDLRHSCRHAARIEQVVERLGADDQVELAVGHQADFLDQPDFGRDALPAGELSLAWCWLDAEHVGLVGLLSAFRMPPALVVRPQNRPWSPT